MTYVFLILLVLLLYVRPGDLVSGLEHIPWVKATSLLVFLSLIPSIAVGNTRARWAPAMTWLIGTWAAFVFSHVPHGYLGGTLMALNEFAVNVLLALAVFLTLDRESRIRGFTTAWIAGSVFLAVGGLVQSVTGIGWGGQELVKGRIQGVGIFGDPNDLAVAFIVAIPLAHARFFKRSAVSSALFFGLTALFTYATFLTNSRGGVLSLLAVLAALSLRRYGRKLGVFVAVLVISGLFVLGPSRLGDLDSKEASAQGRIAAWSAGLQMLKQYPVWGVGYGRFLEYNRLTAHNSFVLCFAEAGLLGAYFWLGLFYACIVALRRVGAVRDPPTVWRRWAVDTQIAFLGLLCAHVFLSRTYDPIPYLLVGFGAAVYRCAVDDIPSARFSMLWHDRRLVAAFVVGGVVSTYVLVRMLSVWTSRFY